MIDSVTQYRDVDDISLVDLIRDQDEVGFSELLYRYGGLMRGVAKRYVGNYHDADDVVQEAALQVWESIDTLKDPKVLRAWVLRITVRKAVDLIRKRKPEANLEAAQAVESRQGNPEQETMVESENAAIKDVFSQMPLEYQRIWVLRHIGGFSYREIAAELKLSVATVRGRLSRIKQKLVVEMEEWR